MSAGAVSAESLNKTRFVFRSLWFYRRSNIAIALGVATAATVIIGALLVGDSMRGSLRALTIERLGRIDEVIIPGNFFPADSIPEQSDQRDLVPVIFFDQAIVELAATDTAAIRRAGSVQVLGVDERFNQLDATGTLPSCQLSDSEIMVNQAVADELSLKLGDEVTVRLPSEQAVPADNPLGRRDSQTESLPRLKVKAIVPNQGLGRFALQPNQSQPLLAWVSREAVAEALQREGQANMLMASRQTETSKQTDPEQEKESWTRTLPFTLAHFGLKATEVQRNFQDQDSDQDQTVLHYYQLTSDRLLLADPVVDHLTKASTDNLHPLPVLTYLANAIERVDKQGQDTASVPYSVLTATDGNEQLLLDFGSERSLQDAVPIVLNSWCEQALKAKVGDRLRIAYYEPEVSKGQEIERMFDAVVTAIVPVTKPSKPYRRTRSNEFDQKPTVYNDPDLTPTVPGVTDQDSIEDWDLPFKLERKISAEDDRYWADYRLTPKAFIPLAAGRKYFGSRFGHTTSLRFSPTAFQDLHSFETQIETSLVSISDELGWRPIPLRQNQLLASQGTTPFDGLFLALSLFVIIAAVLLISLLYRLSMLTRSREYGLLLASGYTGATVTRLAFVEGLASALLGTLIGCGFGPLYAMIVIYGLHTWWVGAISAPFLEFHWTLRSFAIGIGSSLLVSVLTIWLTGKRIRKAQAQSLLSGQLEVVAQAGRGPEAANQKTYRKLQIANGIVLLLALAAIVGGTQASGMAQAGTFVAAGMLLLVGAILFVYQRLSQAAPTAHDASYRLSLPGLAMGNLRRNPLRSTLAVGLMSVATFLILSMGAFQMRPTANGVGGFPLMANVSTPIYRDLNRREVQTDIFGNDTNLLAQTKFVAMRVKSGQDASCNNLYRASQPQVLGVADTIAESSDRPSFDWAGWDREAEPEGGAAVWRLLQQPADGTEANPIPVIIDQNTAMWSLQLTGGIGQTMSYTWDNHQAIHFIVVGLLSNSVLQGSLIIGEANFKKAYPDISGYQRYLIATDKPERVSSLLENRLSDVGMDTTSTAVVLTRMLAVQNTYLKTFQSLGALGLLLGTIGLAIAQLRSAIERRSELGLLQAIGFSKQRVGRSILVESAVQLAIGIGCGAVCAIIAVGPLLIASNTPPPVLEPLLAVAGIAIVGMAAGFLSARQVMRMPLLQAMRS